MRIIQVGLGPWGRDWAANVLPIVENIDIAAFVDIDATAIEKARADGLLAHSMVFDNLATAIRETDADGVLITAAIAAHASLVRTALEAGRHVLVEKPFTPTRHEARPLVEIAQAKDLTLAVVQNYRFDAAPVLVSRLVSEGVLGEVRGVSVDFRRFHPYEVPSLHPELDQSILVQLAIHHFDLMRAILRRDATSVYCHVWTPAPYRAAAPAAASAIVEFDGGAVGTYRGNMLSTGDETPWSGLWRIECTDGDIFWSGHGGPIGGLRFDDNQRDPGHVEVRPRGRAPERQALPATLEGRLLLLEGFADAVETGAELSTSGRDNLGSLAMMNAAQLSAACGTRVAVEHPFETDPPS